MVGKRVVVTMVNDDRMRDFYNVGASGTVMSAIGENGVVFGYVVSFDQGHYKENEISNSWAIMKEWCEEVNEDEQV